MHMPIIKWIAYIVSFATNCYINDYKIIHIYMHTVNNLKLWTYVLYSHIYVHMYYVFIYTVTHSTILMLDAEPVCCIINWAEGPCIHWTVHNDNPYCSEASRASKPHTYIRPVTTIASAKTWLVYIWSATICMGQWWVAVSGSLRWLLHARIMSTMDRFHCAYAYIGSVGFGSSLWTQLKIAML